MRAIQPEHSTDGCPTGNVRMIAAQAQSLRATLLRDRRPGDPVTYADLADAVELVQLLATELADLAEPSTSTQELKASDQRGLG